MPLNNEDFHAFTLRYKGRVSELITDIGVSLPHKEKSVKKSDGRIFSTSALWDTGATNSVITTSTAKQLSLQPISKAKVYHADGMSLQNVYMVNLYLPNNLIIPFVKVTECDDNAGTFGVIIGMDIICSGDFTVTNVNNETVFSFRLPSIDVVDYVEESNLKEKLASAGRNDQCPCGSGKKFKYCHGR